MGVRTLIGSIAAALILLAGCGSGDDDEAPAACLAGSEAYLRALEAAPAEVRLEGVPISECLTPAQEGGELARIGEQLVVAATRLNREASRDPGGPATVQLGYLIGAASRGADSIHTDLILRLNVAARYSAGEGQSAAFNRGFNRGYAAGQESG